MLLPHQHAPARLAGDTYLIIDYVDMTKNPRAAWKYFGGQRRVRRAPVFAFDTPVPPRHQKSQKFFSMKCELTVLVAPYAKISRLYNRSRNLKALQEE